MEEVEKMVALKKAYADIILNTAKEAAARIMVSERKALRFHQDLCGTKDEALGMLIRLKHMIDSKAIEAEITSLTQQKRIGELEAQLNEAEETTLELRAELKKTQDQLDKVKNKHMRPLHGSIEKRDGPCDKSTKYEKLTNSNPILSYPTESEPNIMTPELKSTALNQRFMDRICCNSAKQSASFKSDLQNVCPDNPDFASMIMRSKEPELYRNGCTQRVRAFERNLLDGNLPSSGNLDDVHFLINSASITKVNEQNIEICTVLPPETKNTDIMKNPTQSEDVECIRSCTNKDQLFKFRKVRRRRTRYGKAKATSCRFSPNLVKPCRPSPVDSYNVKSGEGACTLPHGEAENTNLAENSSGLEEKMQQNKDQASVRRSLRKRKIKYRDAIATSCRSLPNQLIKPCPVLFHCKTYPVHCNVEPGEDQPYSESETKTKTGVDPISGSTDATPHNNAGRVSGFFGNAIDKNRGLVEEAVLVKWGGDTAESPRVPGCKLNRIDNIRLMDSDSKDGKTSEANSGTSSQADNNRLVKYTFSRKRKKETLTDPDENTSLGKNSGKKMLAEKQNGAPEPQKSSLIDESSRDSRRMVQVARQLISLSGKRCW